MLRETSKGTLELNEQTNAGTLSGEQGSVTVKALSVETVKQWQSTLSSSPIFSQVEAGVVIQTADGKTWLQSGSRVIYRSGPVKGYSIPARFPNWMSGGQATDYRTASPHSVPQTSWRASFFNRGGAAYVAKQFKPGPAGNIFKDLPQPAPPSQNSFLWNLADQATVPQAPGAPVVLINDFVPQGYRLRLATFAFKLGPSTTWEDNYIWRLQIGGFDVLNPYGSNQRTGRPVRSDAPVQLSPQLEDLPVFGPGTPIVVTVQAVAPVAAGDVISASLVGSLWGDK